MRKLKFYLLGLIPGILFVFFILNKKGASCSGYLPNSRVIAETLSKDFEYSPEFETAMSAEHIDEKQLKDVLLKEGSVNFEHSRPRQKPCPDYVLTGAVNQHKYEVHFRKCAEVATFKTLRRIP